MAEKWHENSKLQICASTIGCTNLGEVFPIRCKRWDCPTCAAINARLHSIKVANGIYALICAGVRPKFITLTLTAHIRPQLAFETLRDMWHKMEGRITYGAKKAGVPFAYAAFVETQIRGVPHFHIVTTFAPGKTVLKLWAVKSGMGYMVDVEWIRNRAGVAWYVTKYASKVSGKIGLPKGFRRVRYSENFPGIVFRIDQKRPEAGVMVKQYRESVQSFIYRVRQTLHKDITQEVAALVDMVKDKDLTQFVEGYAIMD